MEADPFGAVDDAITAVQEVLESMMSKENLVRDQFLARNMNAQMDISIPILLSHAKLADVGATPELVVAAATRSARLRIDDAQQMVRPSLKDPRNVIVLRDIPSDATKEEIRKLLFSGPYARSIAGIKPLANNRWFAKYLLDDGIEDVASWLRSQQFKGRLVNALIPPSRFSRRFTSFVASIRREDLGTTTGQPPEDGRGKGKSWGDEDKGGWDKGGRGKDKGGWGKDKGDRGKGRGALVAGRPGHVRSLPIRPGRVRVVAGRLVPCDKRALQWSARYRPLDLDGQNSLRWTKQSSSLSSPSSSAEAAATAAAVAAAAAAAAAATAAAAAAAAAVTRRVNGRAAVNACLEGSSSTCTSGK